MPDLPQSPAPSAPSPLSWTSVDTSVELSPQIGTESAASAAAGDGATKPVQAFPIDGVEIHCTADFGIPSGGTVVEPLIAVDEAEECQPQSLRWTVYLHHRGRGVEAMGDYDGRDLARFHADALALRYSVTVFDHSFDVPRGHRALPKFHIGAVVFRRAEGDPRGYWADEMGAKRIELLRQVHRRQPLPDGLICCSDHLNARGHRDLLWEEIDWDTCSPRVTGEDS